MAFHHLGIPQTMQIGSHTEKPDLKQVSALIVVIADMQRLVQVTDQVDEELESLLFLRVFLPEDPAVCV